MKIKRGDRWLEKRTGRVVEVLSQARGFVHFQNVESRRTSSMMLKAFERGFEFKEAKKEPEIIYRVRRAGRPGLRKAGVGINQLPLPGIH